MPRKAPAAFLEAAKRTQFQKGEGGRQNGSRNLLGIALIKALSADFHEHGEDAIRRAREEDPVAYVRVLASILPKEVEVKRPLSELTDDELTNAIELIRASLGGSVDEPSEGAAEAGGGEPPSAVPALH